jgi:hypothetical protein
MERGDRVAYVRDPGLYGPMLVEEVTFRGWVWCVEDHDGELRQRCGPFKPAELDDAAKFYLEPVPS